MQKIRKIKLNNFAEFTDFECEFNDKVTNLVGVNGSGKTTIGLTALWAGLKGIAEKNKDGQLIGDRFRFIGQAKASADIEIHILDTKLNQEVIVKNHITKAGNKITCSPVQSEEWLNDLLSVAFLSAKNFTAMTSKEQALSLGVDVSNFDTKITDLKSDYTVINKQLRNLGEIREIEKTKPIDVNDVVEEKQTLLDAWMEKKDKAEVKNKDINDHNLRIELTNIDIKDLELNIEELQTRLKELKDSVKDKKKKQSIDVPEKPDTSELDEQINNAKEINKKAAKYEKYVEVEKSKNSLTKQLNKNKDAQKKIENEKLDFIKSFDFGFDNLSVDEKGGLLLNNKPIKEPYFSKGELEVIVAKLYAATNPKLRLRFIDDFDLIDPDNQEKLLKELLDDDFQVITAEVGKEAKSENTILLRECKKVKSYKEKKKL